jgi:hypothetical protein
MADINLNTGINGIRGRINGWIYKQVNGRTILAPIPVRSTKPPSAGQIAQRESFANAASYGRSVLADPLLRPIYEGVSTEQRKPIFAVAIGDFFTPPRITFINVSNYHGAVGQKIKVLAVDDVQVMSVRVELRETTGVLIEQGAAIKTGEDWFYTATTLVALGRAIKIVATATDRPGNTGLREITHTVSAA